MPLDNIPLQPDKSKTFFTSFCRNLIRTGTIGDGSCFFHAVLYSLLPSYRGMDHTQRQEEVARLRQRMASSFTVARWKQLGHGELYKMQILDQLRTSLETLFPSDVFMRWDTHYLPVLAHRWTSTKLSSLRKRFEMILEVVTCNPVPDLDTNALFARIEKDAYEAYLSHLRTGWVDDALMELLSEHFQCNFHFIQASTRLPYRTFAHHQYETHVILCWLDDEHYESVGLIDLDNRIRRVFVGTSDLIEKLKSINNNTKQQQQEEEEGG